MSLKCPHCNVVVLFRWTSFDVQQFYVGQDDKELNRVVLELEHSHCPNCKKLVVHATFGQMDYVSGSKMRLKNPSSRFFVVPRSASSGRVIEPEVPQNIKSDYLSACEVLPFSPKASAALSRRLLQQILRDHFGINHPTLDREIQEFIGRSDVPTPLKEVVDAVRVVGNLAAHPMKDQRTGEIVEVEPGEAEWLLEVLESLFDFAYIQPVRNAAKTAALNARLAALGKPPIRTP